MTDQTAELKRLRVLLDEMEEDNPGSSALKQAEWRGGVSVLVAQLVKGQEHLEKRVDNLVWKVAGIAATVSILSALAQNLF